MTVRTDLTTGQIRRLLESLPRLDESDDEFGQLLHDMLEAETDLPETMERLARAEARDHAALDGLKVERASFTAAISARIDRKENSTERARDAMHRLLDAAGLRKWETPLSTISLRKSKPGAVITDEDQIPAEFWRVATSLDRAKIRQALTGGEDVPGAALNNAMPSISIRRA